MRNLRQQRGFTATVVMVLALAIGLNTTLFTVLAGIALRPWQGIADPSRVVRLYLADPTGHAAGFSLPDARALASRASTLAGVGIMKNEPVRVGTGDAAAAEALMVSGNFFDVLGVRWRGGADFSTAKIGSAPRRQSPFSVLPTGSASSAAIRGSWDRRSESMTSRSRRRSRSGRLWQRRAGIRQTAVCSDVVARVAEARRSAVTEVSLRRRRVLRGSRGATLARHHACGSARTACGSDFRLPIVLRQCRARDCRHWY